MKITGLQGGPPLQASIRIFFDSPEDVVFFVEDSPKQIESLDIYKDVLVAYPPGNDHISWGKGKIIFETCLFWRDTNLRLGM